MTSKNSQKYDIKGGAMVNHPVFGTVIVKEANGAPVGRNPDGDKRNLQLYS